MLLFLSLMLREGFHVVVSWPLSIKRRKKNKDKENVSAKKIATRSSKIKKKKMKEVEVGVDIAQLSFGY